MISISYAVLPASTAYDIDIQSLRAELKKLFGRQHYIGMFEPGFYPRQTFSGSSEKGAVSWHAHLVFWGPDRDRLLKIINRYNDRTTGMLFDVPPANVRPRSWTTMERSIVYFMKSPAKSYACYRVPERIDPNTGEILSEHDHQIAQKLRLGQHVHMRNTLSSFAIDDLLLAAGTGQLLVKPLQERMERDRERYERTLPLAMRSCNREKIRPSRQKR